MSVDNLDWEPGEKEQLANRILLLHDSQIWELFNKVGITHTSSMEEVMQEMREKGLDSVNLNMLLTESDSKENLVKRLIAYEQEFMTR